ncbi:MAG: hypothetical protein ACQXXH_07160 [Candidatus Bathyarchaeia archaeon]|nr:hypothetical protein [Candidatus Bathyarchaeota archaeon A05DMB-4]MDH7595722.1 hypothetical protein [Candidatus Bathyarchaeota archaeon]
MKTKELKDNIEILREINKDYVEMSEILNDNLKSVARETRSLNKLWRSKNHSKLVKIGMALILFPDPTISDVVGTAMVAAGLLHNKVKNSGLYLEDVYKTYPKLLKELYLEK